MAETMAHILAERTGKPALLITLEHYPKHAYPGNMLLLFGNRSLRRNPLIYDVKPSIWSHLHGTLAWGLMNGGHGEYFREPAILDLCQFVEIAIKDYCRTGRIEPGE